MESIGTFTNTATLGSTLPNYGISTVGTSSGISAYKLAVPAAGVMKTIAAYALLSSTATITSTGATIGSTYDTIKLGKLGESIQLVGLSATAWGIVGKSTGAVLS